MSSINSISPQDESPSVSSFDSSLNSFSDSSSCSFSPNDSSTHLYSCTVATPQTSNTSDALHNTKHNAQKEPSVMYESNFQLNSRSPKNSELYKDCATKKTSSKLQSSSNLAGDTIRETNHKSGSLRLKQFVRLEPLRTLSAVRTQQKGEEFICAFLSVQEKNAGAGELTKRQFSRICTLAEDYEDKHAPKRVRKEGEERKPPLLYRFEIMIHEDFPSEQFLPMFSEILTMLEATGLPFALFRRKKGHGTYAVAYIVAHPYYPEGIYKETIANHDYYVDEHNICCKPDAPGARIRWHKGDILSRKIITFGNKTQKLSGTASFFNNIIKRVKYSVRTFLKNLGTPLRWGFYFRKIPQREYRNYRKKACVSEWNRTFCHMEFSLNRFVDYAQECGIDAQEDIRKIYNKYNSMVQDFIKNRKEYTRKIDSPSFSVRLKKGYPKRTCYFLISGHRISDTKEYCAVLLYSLALDLRRLSLQLFEGNAPEEHRTKEEEAKDFAYWHDLANSPDMFAYMQ